MSHSGMTHKSIKEQELELEVDELHQKIKQLESRGGLGYIIELENKIKRLRIIEQTVGDLFEEIEIIDSPYLSSHKIKMARLNDLIKDKTK